MVERKKKLKHKKSIYKRDVCNELQRNKYKYGVKLNKKISDRNMNK